MNGNLNTEEIWDSWSKHYLKIGVAPDQICYDGIINEQKYNETDPKILYVMKEVNDYAGGDLKRLLKNGPKYQMWHAIARWSAGIINDFPPFSKINNKKSMREAIHSVASINLKKTTGKASAKEDIINAFAFRDRNLLIKQIKSISPDIIVAGGTFNTLIWLLDLNVNPNKPNEKPIIDDRRNIKVIPWRHPARVNNKKSYQELKSMFQNS